MRFEFAHSGALEALFAVLGMGPRHSWIRVDGDRLRIRMSWAFRMDAPVESVASTEVARDPIPLWMGLGVHGWGRQWAVNTARTPHAVIHFSTPQHARLAGIPLKVETLHLSPSDPVGLASALRG